MKNMENIMQNIIMENIRVFSNGVAVVNTTPHPITFQDGADTVTVPASRELLINAVPTEQTVDALLVKTSFSGSAEGMKIIDAILVAPMPEGATRKLIVGSIIAAQAYPGWVVAMTPAPGYERVAPAEKRMSVSKFTTY